MPFFNISMEVNRAENFSLGDLAKELTAIERQAFPQAMSRTVNELGAKAKTAATRAMVGKMGIKRKFLNKRYFKVSRSKARGPDFEYSWSGTSKPLPLSYFKGRGLKHGSKKGRRGYAASPLGARRKYFFFEARMSSGHVGAFIRDPNAKVRKGGAGKVGAYPIKQRFGPSIPVGMIQDETDKAWTSVAGRKPFEERFRKNLEFYVSRIRKR